MVTTKITISQTIRNYGSLSFVVKTTEIRSKESEVFFLTQIFGCTKHLDEDCKNPERFIDADDRYWTSSSDRESALMKHNKLTSEFTSLIDSGEILDDEESRFWWQKD